MNATASSSTVADHMYPFMAKILSFNLQELRCLETEKFAVQDGRPHSVQVLVMFKDYSGLHCVLSHITARLSDIPVFCFRLQIVANHRAGIVRNTARTVSDIRHRHVNQKRG